MSTELSDEVDPHNLVHLAIARQAASTMARSTCAELLEDAMQHAALQVLLVPSDCICAVLPTLGRRAALRVKRQQTATASRQDLPPAIFDETNPGGSTAGPEAGNIHLRPFRWLTGPLDLPVPQYSETWRQQVTQRVLALAADAGLVDVAMRVISEVRPREVVDIQRGHEYRLRARLKATLRSDHLLRQLYEEGP